MTATKSHAQAACEKADLAATNSADVLAFLQAARKWRKHARTGAGFLIGILSAMGIGNPAVLAFIKSFFGIS